MVTSHGNMHLTRTQAALIQVNAQLEIEEVSFQAKRLGNKKWGSYE